VNLIGSYNYALVTLSVLIATFAAYAALDLASRVTAASGWTRAVWLLGGAAAMGTGIWSMHYIGMLAFVLPVPVAYHWPTVLLSLFAAIVASVVALYVVSRQKMGAFRAFTGSVLMGAGIASMHYIGMAAMRVSAMCQFSSALVALSVVFAVLISLAALWITFHLRDERAGLGRRKIAGAAVMGAAIPVMHYTGMAAASFTASDMPLDLTHAVNVSTLGTLGIASVTVILLGLTLVTSWVDRRFAVRTLELQEGKLKQSEAYLSEAQRLSHTGSFGWRVSTGEIIWSEETFRIFQYDRTITPTVERILHRVHPDDAALVKQTIECASRDGKDFEHEYRLVMPDRSIRYVHVVAHAVSDEASGTQFVGAVMDVTGQHRATAALEEALDEIQKSQSRLRLVIDTIPGMVWSGQPDGSFDYVNEPWLRYLGCSWEELSARGGLVSVVHPDDVEESVARWNATRAAGRHIDHELRMRRADGEYCWFLARALPLRDEGGNIVRWYGTATDIEDRKRAETLLAGEKRLFEMMARGESRSLTLDALCRLVEELSGGSLASILLLDQKTNYLRHGAAPSLPILYTQAIDGIAIGPSVGSCGTAAYRAEPVIVSDISTDPLWANYRDLALAHGLQACWSTPILSAARRVLGTFAIYHREPRSPTPQDHNLIEQITHLASIAVERDEAQLELRASEDALRQAQVDLAHVSRVTTLGEMAASIAHEVDQPLSGVVINANACLRFLAGQTPNLGEVRDGLQAIARDGRRASDVIARIRALARGTPAEKAPLDINELIREVVVLAEGEARRTHARVRIELAEDLPRVVGDPVQLQQVVLNLLLNGLDAMSAVVDRPRELVVSTQPEAIDHVHVAVQDSGVGLDPQLAHRMFEAFYTTKRGGLGMGLSISRSIVEQHGGQLWAVPNDGAGTTFHFTV
jgi:PAS domain S-box-containing protein